MFVRVQMVSLRASFFESPTWFARSRLSIIFAAGLYIDQARRAGVAMACEFRDAIHRNAILVEPRQHSVTQHVRCDFSPLQRWALALGGPPVASYQSLDGIPTQVPATTAGEDWHCRLGRALAQPLGQHGNRFRTQWRASFLSTFSTAA